MKILSERLEEIATLIAEVANGNFDYKIDVPETGDELDAILAGVNMLGQELKNSTVSRDFMKSIFQGIVDMLLILDTDLRIRTVNIASEELIGYKEDELKGVHIGKLIQESDNPLFSEHIQAFEKQGKFLGAELLFTTKQGKKIPTSCSFSYLTNSHRQNDGILIIAKDISQLKQTERELQEAKNKAEAANEAKSNFLSNMSHEIRTPLNGIMGFTELLMKSPLNDSQKNYLNLIQTSGETLFRLLNDILDLHRIEQDRISVEMVPFNYKEIISSNLGPYKHHAESKGLSFFNKFDGSIPEMVTGDPGRINQVLVNLISNAIKFTKEGSIVVHHKAEPGDDDTVIITATVTDTGQGIPPAKQALIFDPFTQSDESVTRKYGGSGLGLTISKKLVNIMHGDLGVVSPVTDMGTGSSFWFTVRLKRTESGKRVQTKRKDGSKFKLREGIKILIADDNDINTLLMHDVLKSFGATVTTAENGGEALEKALLGSYDLIFMDLQMPVMSGIEATIHLRESNFKAPIIAFSAAAYREDIHKSLEIGMNDYLCKPFTQSDLIEILEKWT